MRLDRGGLRALAFIAILAGTGPIVVFGQPYAGETKEERDARMGWWREARFGMFIHWGVYAVPAGEHQGRQYDRIGEWIMHEAEIPVAEYREFSKRFNPVNYDPEFWADLAKDAGMRYIVITSKHHDGFALFPSDVTDWDVAGSSPYGRDLIGPLAEAVRKRGLRFGLYYSQAQDWVHPGGAKARFGLDGWDPAHAGDFDEYLSEVAIPQTKEILERFRPDILWWDTPVNMTEERARRFLPLLEPYPHLIVNNRLVRPTPRGDFDTPEQRIPGTGIEGDWETCMTMNRTWGYKHFDHDWKSTETLLTHLIDIASKGGNYLLNIGPKADGTIPQESIDRLRGIGRWMKVNGESIYGTTASPTARPSWGRITTMLGEEDATLYLHVFDWPEEGKLEVPIANEVKDCRLLAEPARKCLVDQSDRTGLTVQLTGAAPDPVASVVVLKVGGAPDPLVQATPQCDDGSVTLKAVDVDIFSRMNTQPRVDSLSEDSHLGYWFDATAWLRFTFQITEPGEFDLTLEAAAVADDVQIDVKIADQTVRVEAPNTGSGDVYAQSSPARVRLPDSGIFHLDLQPVEEGWEPVNLKAVRLVPADPPVN